MDFVAGVGQVDQDSGISVALDAKSAYVHMGKAFTHSGKTSIANGASNYHTFVTPAGIYAHVWQVFAQADAAPMDMYIFEDSTVTVLGSAQTPVNGNRNSATASQVGVYNGSTVTVDGTQLDYVLLAGSRQAGGIGVNNVYEMVFKPNTTYTIKVVNNSGSAANFGLYIGWVELTYQ